MYNYKFIKNEAIIKHIKKEIYFCDVNFFIERARNHVLIKSIKIIKKNL